MKKKEREELKQLLEKEKESLLSQIEHLENNSLNKSQREASGDLSGYSFHMADMGTDNFDREFALALVSSEQKLLYEVNEALRRLEEGGFGCCEQCGKSIGRKRLQAVPYARLCIKCEEKKEKEEKREKG
ncbi:TraR/DksA family transcriptional regulator [candidate division NPL-UPA2 bacterium]|nr:TraR/DksA family transcriptional regulator [candidate division NPL-UPA2 bacterium]